MTPYDPVIRDGSAFALFAYDVGLSIGLDAAEKNVKAMAERAPIRHQRRAPQHFEFHPIPLRVTQTSTEHAIAGFKTLPTVETVLYDFGAVCVTYQIPLSGPFSALLPLSETLYDNEILLADSRRLVEELIAGIKPAVNRPHVARFYEDYAVFQLREFTETDARERLLRENPLRVAQVLRADGELKSEQEIKDALACQISYADDDLTLIDWASAIIFDKNADDTRVVLEFGQVQLLELRHLDNQLDAALDRCYLTLTQRAPRHMGFLGRGNDELKAIGELQVESAVLFEGVNNAIKLLGDQYLARLHEQIASRYHLKAWDQSILRKLRTLESIYDQLENRQSSARLEFLEWIVIILIAFEIILAFIPHR